MKHAIITGASYGLGYAIAERLSIHNFNLHIVSRTIKDEKLKLLGKNTRHYKFDLNNINDISTLINDIFSNIKNIEEIVLINNAGILAPMDFMGKLNDKDIIQHINVNSLSVMLICNNFIKHLKNYNYKEAKVINISSGAAKAPYPAWSMYCSSKAALKMLSSVMAKEEEYQNNNIKFLSFAPGVLDTNMQEQIRKQDNSNFPLIDKFKKLHDNNLLFKPSFVAYFFYNKFIKNDFKNGDFIDIRDYI